MGEIKEAVYTSYNNHDCESWYQCPYCKKPFGSWSIFHQKQEGEEAHCPHCEKPLIVPGLYI